MSFPRCLLRPVVPEDWGRLLEWRNRPAVRQAMYHSDVISAEEHYRYCQRLQDDPSKQLLIGYDAQGEPLGVVNFSAIDAQQSSAAWGFYALGTAGQGSGSALTFSALGYAFDSLQLYKLNAEVLAFNQASQRLHRKFGFRSEGVWQQHYLRDGQRHDVQRLALFASDWQWLQPRWQQRLYGGSSLRYASPGHVGKVQSLQASIPEDALEPNSHLLDSVTSTATTTSAATWHYCQRYLLPQLWAHYDGHGQALPLRQSISYHAALPSGRSLELRLRILSHFQHSLIGWLEARQQDRLLLEAEIEYPYASGDL